MDQKSLDYIVLKLEERMQQSVETQVAAALKGRQATAMTRKFYQNDESSQIKNSHCHQRPKRALKVSALLCFNTSWVHC